MLVRDCEGGVGLAMWKDAPQDVIIPDCVANGKQICRLIHGCFQASEIRSVRIGVNVRVIESDAFRWCGQLREVWFEDGSAVKEIGENAFSSCRSLVSFFWPRGVEEIPERCFKDCDFLSDFRFEDVNSVK